MTHLFLELVTAVEPTLRLSSTKDGRAILDATGGAAVSCLGHGDNRVIEAMTCQMGTGITYIATSFFGSGVSEALCKELINGTDRKMARVYLTGSGKSL
jgi:adenosylmethionine-8-amino-7-oxononanoate aminotransferase